MVINATKKRKFWQIGEKGGSTRKEKMRRHRVYRGGRLSWHNLCNMMTDICQTKIVYFIKIYYLYTKLFLEYYGKESESCQREIH